MSDRDVLKQIASNLERLSNGISMERRVLERIAIALESTLVDLKERSPVTYPHDPNVAARSGAPAQHASWSLAHNLDSRTESLKDAYPGITVWSIGDQSHQNNQSDHNPDARDIVHALDVMTYSDTSRGEAVRDWCLAAPDDLEYVIFNRKIYSRSSGFAARDYSGSDPHTDHVHVSGKHGSVGYDSATGTGYDTAAEAMRPAGFDEEDDMNEGQADQLNDINWSVARGAEMPDGEGNYAITYWAGDVNETLASLVNAVNELAGRMGTAAAAVSTRRAERARRLDEARAGTDRGDSNAGPTAP